MDTGDDIKRCWARDSHAGVLHNTRVKTYPDGSCQVMVCEVPIFRPDGWEEDRQVRPQHQDPKPDPYGPERAVRRAKAKVKDLALCSNFRWFVTLTLDSSKVDRYDVEEITRKLNHWLDNQVRRKGLCYVLVPERHKDGAIHFHGFFNDALGVVDSGTVIRAAGGRPRKPRSVAQRAAWLEEGGHVVYNLPGWSLGFTTAIELYGDYHRAVAYVCKYIGKDLDPDGHPRKVGGRWYYSGGELGHPQVAYCDLPLSWAQALPGAYTFAVKDAHKWFVLVEMEGGGSYEKVPRADRPTGPSGPVGDTEGLPLFGLLPEK